MHISSSKLHYFTTQKRFTFIICNENKTLVNICKRILHYCFLKKRNQKSQTICQPGGSCCDLHQQQRDFSGTRNPGARASIWRCILSDVRVGATQKVFWWPECYKKKALYSVGKEKSCTKSLVAVSFIVAVPSQRVLAVGGGSGPAPLHRASRYLGSASFLGGGTGLVDRDAVWQLTTGRLCVLDMPLRLTVFRIIRFVASIGFVRMNPSLYIYIYIG